MQLDRVEKRKLITEIKEDMKNMIISLSGMEIEKAISSVK